MPFSLRSKFTPAGDQPAAIKTILNALADDEQFITLLGATGTGKTFTMANVIAQSGRPALIMAPNKTLAAQLYAEMKEFFPENAVEYFVSYYDYYQPEAYVPASDTYIEKDSNINEHIERMRLSATKSLLERRDVVIVASVSAIYGLGDVSSYKQMLVTLKVGEKLNQRELFRSLVAMQYNRNDVNLARGNFRVKGEVIDIFPADSEELSIRIETFDEEIERMYYFDALTGEKGEDMKQITIYPQTHFVTPKDKILAQIDNIKAELRERKEYFLSQNRFIEAQRITERVQMDLELLGELGFCKGIENYSLYLSGRQPGEPPPTFFDYLPDDTIIMIDESHIGVSQIGGMFNGDRARKQTLVDFGFRLPSALENRPLRFEEFLEKTGQTLLISATPANFELEHSAVVAEQLIRPTGLIDPEVEVREARTQVDDVLGEIHKRIAQGERVLITTLTKKMSERLSDFLLENDIKARYLHSDIDTVERVEIIRDLRLGVFDVLIGINLLREGLDMPEVSLVAIMDADKEGFLRSERSLVQTIGRAARNIHGKAILYGDTITKSMQKAIDETNRRREKQIAYNEAHGITPTPLNKAIVDILESDAPKGSEDVPPPKPANQLNLSPVALSNKIKELEKKMYTHAERLEFEAAAQVRNEIKELKQAQLLA